MRRLLILLALVLCSCAETFVGEEVARQNNANLPDLTAAFAEAGDTRTYIEEGKYLRWHEDDRLTAFYGNTLNSQYKFNGATGDNSGTFSLVPSGELGTGNAFDRIYALYPYNADARITDEGVISLTLPAVQNYAENSFGHGANTMLAVTENLEDTFLAFKNACGYLKLKLYNAEGTTIKSIEVKGNSGERLAGTATASIAFGEAPVLVVADDATTSVTLDCGEGVALGTTAETATEFWVVLPATTFAEGLTITATDTEGGVFEKSTTNEVIIERNAIQPMAALEVIYVNSENCKIYYEATKKLIPYKTNVFGANIISNEWNETTGEGVITFDGEVTQIGDYAFYNDDWFERSVNSLTIPESVTHIGCLALYCRFLDNIVIPKNVKSIEEGALAYSSNIYFTNPIPIEHTKCFCDGDFAVDRIYVPYQNLIEYCSKWSNYSESIFGFDYDSNTIYLDDLTKIKYTTTDNYQLDIDNWSIVAHEFDNGEGTIYISCRSEFNTDIKHSFFKNCKSLKSITIPENIVTIGDYAFYGCVSLTSITIPESVTSIGSSAFSGCTSLTSVTIPDSVTSIGSHAFSGCTSELIINSKIVETDYTYNNYPSHYGWLSGAKFTKLTIGDNITKIGSYAFDDCNRLTSIAIPDSVTTIGDEAFDGCSSLKSVYITDLSAWCRIYFGGKESNPLYYAKNLYHNNEIVTDLVISGDITEIKSYTFYNCSSITNVVIPDSVTTIEGYAFYGCSSITNVTIPDSVTTIEDYAFYGCSSITNVTIPDSVTTIGYYAFYGCRSLTNITIPGSVTEIGYAAFSECDCEIIINSKIIEKDYEDISNKWCDWLGTTSKIVIGDNVTRIGNNAFSSCDMTSITIPDSITEIGYHAFSHCDNLTTVNISNLSSWCKIDFLGYDSNPLTNYLDNAALYINGIKLTDITIPNDIITIKSNTFKSWNHIESLIIPDNITTIEDGAFYACENLKHVTIGNGVSVINKETFCNCENLEKVTLGSGITSIGYDAFCGCKKLKSINIPDSVVSIDTYAFLNCDAIEEITIPQNVTWIGSQSFDFCNILTTIYCKPINPPKMADKYARWNTPIRNIYVPMESVEAYKNAEGWSNYKLYIVGYNF